MIHSPDIEVNRLQAFFLSILAAEEYLSDHSLSKRQLS